MESSILVDSLGRIEGLTPTDVFASLSTTGRMLPVIIMMLLVLGGNVIVASIGLEKENKTLETLLTLPIPRGHFVVSKTVSAALLGIVMVAIYMVGFGFYMSTAPIDHVDLSSYGLSISLPEYGLIAVSTLLALLAGLSMCLVLGSMARSYKDATALLYPIVALILFPTLLVLFRDYDSLSSPLKAVVFLIPFSHPMMAYNYLAFGEYRMVFVGILYLTVFSSAVHWYAFRMYRTERIVVGRVHDKAEK